MNRAQELRSIACDTNWNEIKNQYNAILSSIEASARKGEFSIKIELDKIHEKLAAQLQKDGFSLRIWTDEAMNEFVIIQY